MHSTTKMNNRIKIDLENFLADYLNKTFNTLPNPFQSLPLFKAIRYSLLNGGKRLRPSLVFAVGQTLGASNDMLQWPAASIECIHCYSLVHDDLPSLDNDDLRRGKPTCHKAFDEATAILVGDALQTLAFELLTDQRAEQYFSKNQQIQMLAILAKSIGSLGMVAGQALDLAASQMTITLETLKQLHHHKTGKLFQAAVQLAAISAGTQDQKCLNDFALFANYVGLAFQVKDDILDFESTTEILGKTAQLDQQNHKTTFPMLLGLEAAKTYLAKLAKQAKVSIQAYDQSGYLCDFVDQSVNRAY